MHVVSQLQIRQGMADSEERIASSRERERQHEMLRRTGRIDEALDLAKRAVAAAPDDHEAHNNLGNVLKDAMRPAEALAAFCKDNLAGYKRPRHFVFGPLPRTAAGKIQKFVLREDAARMLAREEEGTARARVLCVCERESECVRARSHGVCARVCLRVSWCKCVWVRKREIE